jgi:hypothetical protein
MIHHIPHPILSLLELLNLPYNEALTIKECATDLAAFILGAMVMLLLAAKVNIRAARIPCEDTDPGEINVTKIKRHGKTQVHVLINSKEAYNLSTITVMTITLRIIYVRYFPWAKNVQIVNKRGTRIRATILFTIVALVCAISVTMDSHIILPTSHGRFIIKDLGSAGK